MDAHHRSSLRLSRYPLPLAIAITFVALFIVSLSIRSASPTPVNAAACVAAPADIAAWWPLSDAAGNNTPDIVGAAQAALINGPAVDTGIVGGALRFDGVNDYASVPDNDALDVGTGDFSIETWFKSSDAVHQQDILDKRDALIKGYEFLLQDGKLSFQLGDPSDFFTFHDSSGTVVADGAWHHLAVTVQRNSPTGLTFYIDGVAASSHDPRSLAGDASNSAALLIGSHMNPPTYPVNGLIDELSLYKRALTASEIGQIFGAGSAGKCQPGTAYRDVGEVRVWAASFVANPDGTVTASGTVRIGARTAPDDGQYFTVGTSVSWNPASGPLRLVGRLGSRLSGLALGEGSFSVDPNAGTVTWEPGAQVLYRKLGTSDLSITPTLSVNVLQRAVAGTAQVDLALPGEQAIHTTVQFTLDDTGAVVGTADSSVQFNLAGGVLTATVRASASGLVASEAQYTLGDIGTITLHDLVIDNKGVTLLHFGASSEFPLHDIDLGNGHFVLTQLKGTLGLSADDQGTTIGYEIGLSGKLVLNNMPENDQITINLVSVKIADGTVTGSVSDFQLNIAGRSTTVKGVQLSKHVFGPQRLSLFPARLDIAEAPLPLPEKWAPKGLGAPVITLHNLALTTQPPYIQLGSASVETATKKPLYLVGKEDSDTFVKIDKLKAGFDYVLADNAWKLTLSGPVEIKLGADDAATFDGELYLAGKHIDGKVDNVTLKVAGLQLAASTLHFDNDVFSAGSASLSLPAKWGGGAVTVSDLRISEAGLSIGGAGGQFPIPDRPIGKVLTLTNMSASVALDAQKHYAIEITAILKVEKIAGGSSFSAGGKLRITNAGVSGSVSSFGFKIAGLGAAVDNGTFVDDHISADSFKLVLPAKLGGAEATLRYLVIGGQQGFSVQGGAFKLPDFKMGTVGVQNAQAEFEQQPNGDYSIKGGAKLQFSAFAIDGRFAIVYDPPSSVKLEKVQIDWEATAPGSGIPIGNTGFFITKIWGGFDLTSGALELNFGLRAATEFAVADRPLLAIDGGVVVKTDPFDLTITASAELVGMNIAKAQVHITSHSFELSAEVKLAVLRGTLYIGLGKDAAGEFTFYGKVSMEIVVPAKVLCVGPHRPRWAHVCLPKEEKTFGGVSVEAGKFHDDGRTVWGARGTINLGDWPFVGRVEPRVFIRFAPGGVGLDVTNVKAYDPVLPARSAQSAYHGLDASAAGYDTYNFTVGSASPALLVAEVVTTTNQLSPLPIQISGPSGVRFTQQLVPEESDATQRIYILAFDASASAIGTWTVRVQSGNVPILIGTDPAPTVTQFSACVAPGDCLATPAGPAQPQRTLQPGVALDLAWRAADSEPNLSLELYAINAQGTRFPISGQQTGAATLDGTAHWAPALASGVYTITLAVTDARLGTTEVHTEPFRIADTTPPAAPRGLQVQPQADGSLLLTWNGDAAEADLQGYRVSVDGREPLVVDGRLSRFETFGLSPASTHRVALSAYDLSGNIGPEATADATLPSLIVGATLPQRDTQIASASEVWATFNKPVSDVVLTIVEGDGHPVAGTVTPINAELSTSETAIIGARFAPASGSLKPGAYIATTRARDAATGDLVEATWSFTVVPTEQRVYLPTVQR